MRLRTLPMLLVGFSLLLTWYYVGGREAIKWENAVRDASVGDWNISQANRWGWENSHWFLPILLVGGALSLIGGTLSLIAGLMRLLKSGVQPTRKDCQ